jgi:hypothetical protein
MNQDGPNYNAEYAAIVIKENTDWFKTVLV